MCARTAGRPAARFKGVRYMKFIILFTTLCLASPVCFAAGSIEELAQKYAGAYLREDASEIIQLRYSVWDQCKESEFNALLRSRTNSITFDSKKFYQDYRLEIEEVVQKANGEKFGFWEGVGQVEYYPVEPTHRITFWAKEGGMSSMLIVNVGGKWYTVHTCAGKDAGKFLELEKQFDGR